MNTHDHTNPKDYTVCHCIGCKPCGHCCNHPCGCQPRYIPCAACGASGPHFCPGQQAAYPYPNWPITYSSGAQATVTE